MERKRKRIHIIRKRQLRFLENTMMKEDFENLIVTRLIEGKKKTTHSMLNEIE